MNVRSVFLAGKGPAFRAWDDWQTGSASERMVRAAILAANPHNTQPWRFHIDNDRLDVFADLTRTTGANDPLQRELYIGLGCAIENAALAGEALGVAINVRLLPDAADPARVALIEMNPAEPRQNELYAQIPERHTNRGPYSSRPIDEGELEELAGLGRQDLPEVTLTWFVDAAARKRVGDGIIAATEAFIGDDKQSSDSFEWFRFGWDEIEQRKDGLTLDAFALSPLITLLGKLLPAQSRKSSDGAWLNQTRNTGVRTAAAFGIVSVADAQSRALQIQGGRLLQRVHLRATASGIALQPMNTMTERADREIELAQARTFGDYLKGLLPTGAGEALTCFRIGYAERRAKRSPRRPIDEVLV